MANSPHTAISSGAEARVHGARPGASKAIATIVVAIDGPGNAGNVLATATGLASQTPSATVHVVHVLRSARLDHARAGVPATPAAELARVVEYLEQQVQTTRMLCANQVVGHFAVGSPVDEIVRVCKETRADVVVVGDPDRHGLERLLLGSLAATLIRNAPCSVLVVRPPVAH
ncbi:MAG TPA: universal stress protein [Polyangiaceae bacterium]|nr:universal stress protein [Polyangiaceae bacterium]